MPEARPLNPALSAPAGEVLGRLRRRRKPPQEAMLRSLPQWVWLLFGLMASAGYLTANPSLTAFAILELAVLVLLLWRHNEPPALFFVCVFQWLEASVAIFYTDYHSTPLRQAANDEFVEATWLSLIGVLVLAAGMRLGMRTLKRSLGQDLFTQARGLSVPRLFNLYLGSFVLFFFLKLLASKIPSLAQPILACLAIKWIVVVLLMFAVIMQRRYYGLLALMIGLESAVGVLGFFSDFKSVYFVFGVILLSAPNAFSVVRLAFIGLVVASVLFMVVVWQAIKVDYREFLNQGTGEQVVLVSVNERVDKLQELMGSLNSDKISLGIESGVLRLSYVQYFGLSLFNVPRNIPYERGVLWWEALTHIFKPRFLFPNKKVINDSERTAYYTGVNVAGADQGTSIGLGYLAESYIDFGPRLMFLPVLGLGFLAGSIYSFAARRARTTLLGVSFATTILMFGGFSLAQSNIKLLGSIIMSTGVLLVLERLCGSYFYTLVSRPASPGTKG